MNLEELNNQYKRLKQNFKKLNDDLKAAEKRLNELAGDRKIADATLELAKRNKNNAQVRKARADISKIETEVNKIKAETEVNKAELKDVSERINEKIRQVREDSTLKVDMDKAISKKSQEKSAEKKKELEKLEEKKEKLNEQKTKVEALKSLADKRATAEYLEKTVMADQEVKALKKELESLKEEDSANPGLMKWKDPRRASEIISVLLPKADKELKKHKESLMGVISRENLSLTERDVQELLLDKAVFDKRTGKLDFDKTFKKQLSSINSQLTSTDKMIEKTNKRIAGLSAAHTKADEITNALDTVDEPKWWQFATRFKNWNERRKAKKLEKEKQRLREAGFDVEESSSEENGSGEIGELSNEFKESLKFEIVKDAVQAGMEEYAKQAEQERTDEQSENDGERG